MHHDFLLFQSKFVLNPALQLCTVVQDDPGNGVTSAMADRKKVSEFERDVEILAVRLLKIVLVRIVIAGNFLGKIGVETLVVLYLAKRSTINSGR